MSHPHGEILGAFLEGTLAPDDLAEVAAHLRQCAECRLLVTETARSESEATETATSSRRWIGLAAAAVVAVVIAVPAIRWIIGRRGTVAHLVAAAPREHRSLEARLSGFRWAPLAPPSRGNAPADPADLKLAGAAGDVLEATANPKTPEARHARGDALLLISRRSEAVAALEEAAHASNDARTWSDLAAARYATAVEDERPSQLPLALEAADRAVALDPKSAEAHFNRALILERMGLGESARGAWQEYLTLDPASDWAAEAREHLRKLSAAVVQFERTMLDSLPPAELVHRFPEEARIWSEGQLLAEWAEHQDEAKLAQVRRIGIALAAANGERLLADSVAAIDAAPPDVRSIIAEGHRLYRDGRMALSRRNRAEAEATLRRAEADFRKGKSPMWEMAAHFADSAALCQQRGSEAEESLKHLRASIDEKRHRAAAAQIDWSLAAAANCTGNWVLGARHADAAAAAYRALGETANAASVDTVAAASLDMLGANDRAWTRWIRASAALDAPRHRARRGTLLRDAALALARFLHPGAAASILNLAAGDLRDDPPQLASALTERARMAVIQDDTETARRTLALARVAASGVRDAALRDVVMAPIDVADASLRRRTDPHGAIAALDRAIGSFTASNVHRILPDAYLERARAYRAAGDAASAKRDYSAALAEVEQQMQSITDGEFRLRFIDTATQVVEETIDLRLSEGEVAQAFAVAEKTRELPGAATGPPPPATTIIEYAVLPHRLAIFCLSNGTLTEKSVTIERADLAAQIAALSDAIRRRAALAEIKAKAGAMYRLLIAPQRQQLSGTDQVVIVPDRQLYSVPFAALYDESRHEYLIEQFAARMAPSASAAEANDSPSLTPALVVADPPGWMQRRLPTSGEEGAQVAAMHGATLLRGNDATRERFLEAAPNSALIHFAGHADSDADAAGALLLADRGDGKGMISSAEIAALHLDRHPLVVLAACGTFRGDPQHVAGIPSVARAFLLAGASSVVGTLWEIDDDVATRLFLQFHQQLRAGAAPATALRSAQLAMLRGAEPKLAHPAAWAPLAIIAVKIDARPSSGQGGSYEQHHHPVHRTSSLHRTNGQRHADRTRAAGQFRFALRGISPHGDDQNHSVANAAL